MIRNLFLTLICACTCSTIATADNLWPGWLGPNRDGWAEGFSVPKTWPQKLSRVWTTPVGEGYASPLIVGDKVYQQGRQGENETLKCLALATGKEIWSSEFAVPFKMGGGGQKHGKGPKSCPVYGDGMVVTLAINGVVSAWNAESGDLVWRRDDRSQFKQNHPYWGASTSPIIDGNRLFVHLGNDDAGALMALDLKTGKVLWTHAKDGTSYSSPLVTEIAGARQLIEWNHNALIGVDIESGTELWRQPFPHVSHNQNMPTPTLYNNTILLGAENRGIQCYKPVQDGDDWRVEELWVQNKLALDMSSAVINEGRLYGYSHYDSGRIFCLSPENGQTIWTGPPRIGQNVTFISMPGHVAALVNSAELKIIRAGTTDYEQVASYRVTDDEAWAPPVMVGDNVLAKGKRDLMLWSLK